MKTLTIAATSLLLTGCFGATYSNDINNQSVIRCYDNGKLVFEHIGKTNVSFHDTGFSGQIRKNGEDRNLKFQTNATCIIVRTPN